MVIAAVPFLHLTGLIPGLGQCGLLPATLHSELWTLYASGIPGRDSRVLKFERISNTVGCVGGQIMGDRVTEYCVVAI